MNPESEVERLREELARVKLGLGQVREGLSDLAADETMGRLNFFASVGFLVTAAAHAEFNLRKALEWSNGASYPYSVSNQTVRIPISLVCTRIRDAAETSVRAQLVVKVLNKFDDVRLFNSRNNVVHGALTYSGNREWYGPKQDPRRPALLLFGTNQDLHETGEKFSDFSRAVQALMPVPVYNQPDDDGI